jgi:hypothetical protein
MDILRLENEMETIHSSSGSLGQFSKTCDDAVC